jgi:hypothetical protein
MDASLIGECAAARTSHTQKTAHRQIIDIFDDLLETFLWLLLAAVMLPVASLYVR